MILRGKLIQGQTSLSRFVLFFAVLSLLSCQNNYSKKNPVLILAIENYSPETNLCDWESGPEVQKMLNLFCERATSIKGVRSSSTYSAAALASLLFGSSEDRLTVKNNQTAVPASFESYPEKFYSLDFQTAFFASSPVFSRRTGISQGFSLFDDTTSVEKNFWGRDSLKLVTDFLRWKKDIKDSYYAVVTFSDLKFPWVLNKNSAGQEQPPGIESQIDSLEESLAELFQKLSSSPEWDNLWIVIVGLQGGRTEFHANQVYASIMPPKNKSALLNQLNNKNENLELFNFSKIFHRIILNESSVNFLDFPDTSEQKTIDRRILNIEPFWTETTPSGSQKRIAHLLSSKSSTVLHQTWLPIEAISSEDWRSVQIFSTENRNNSDLIAFLERVLSSKKTISFQDPCLRMIDLKIIEGGGSKKCDSAFLLSLQDWFRAEDANSSESDADSQLKESRQKALRLWQYLIQQKFIFRINQTLGQPLQLSTTQLDELLKVEMAIHLPSVRAQRIWLERHTDDIATKN